MFQINQSVKVNDPGTVHHGRCGNVHSSGEKVTEVRFDTDTGPEVVAFDPAKLEAL